MNHGDDDATFREDLYKIASTTLSSKLLTAEKNHFGANCGVLGWGQCVVRGSVRSRLLALYH